MANYKDTLNILKTDFEMKANLNVKEPLMQDKWSSTNVYQTLLTQNKHNPQWILHDGPPYANGDIHVGHALNKIIKDVIVRYKSMQGCYSHYIPGWDTHGLPIEHALLKLGVNKDLNLTVAQKRDNCQKFATEQIEKQKTQFKRLGLLTDFREIYRTFDHDYEQRQLELFLKMIDKKMIYQDFKPVYWSWSSQTALADAEIEYTEAKSPSIYVAFKVVDGKNVLKTNDQLIIWTTTPWTIPANLAIAVNPKFEYVRVQVKDAIYVVAKELLSKIAETLHWDTYKVIASCNGEHLEHVTYQHPLYKRTSPIILATYVSKEDGTGLVHNAPGFGEDDYLACKKYNIAPYSPINHLGKFTTEINDTDLVGLFYDDANKVITEKLTKAGSLLHLSFFTHSAAIDWRTKKPVIYRATKQWFIDIKKIQNNLMQALDSVKFKNENSRAHIHDMIKNRTEWCISRQRVWGVPIPIIFDDKNSPILDHDLIKHIIDILSKEGTNVWFEKPVAYFLTAKYQNQKCRKETDIMDVWFDSGTSWTLLKPAGLMYPAELYFEGNDQYRGWFNSSLINAVIDNNQTPYKMLLSHGFVLDEQGRKMSKSLGNVVDPLKVCEKFGADVLRIWAMNSNYQEDVRISDNIVTQCAEIYRRIRNTLFKFCLANISDFDFNKDQQNAFRDEDKYVLYQLNENATKIHQAYQEYDFMTIIKIINNHVIDLSSWYFDLIKDTIYCETKNHPVRRVIQTVLYHILLTYLKLLAPIIPHTAEEVYSFMSLPNKKTSIVLEHYEPTKLNSFDINKAKWDYFFQIKTLVYAELEKIRINKEINKNNQALVEITFNNQYQFNEKDLARYLNVAQVKIQLITSNEIKVRVSNANLVRCERCWNYFEPSQMAEEQLCKRCDNVLKNRATNK